MGRKKEKVLLIPRRSRNGNYYFIKDGKRSKIYASRSGRNRAMNRLDKDHSYIEIVRP
jgi:hypothetical protein